MSKPTLAIDFDGVILDRFGWSGIGTVIGEPMPGAQKVLHILTQRYKIVVHSSRCVHPDGKRAIIRFMKQHQLPFDEVVYRKIDAVAYIDDRGFRFINWEGVLEAFG